MSCDAVAALFMLFAANGPMPEPALIRVADTPVAANLNFAQEPLFVGIVNRAQRLLGKVGAYRGALARDGQSDLADYDIFKSEVKTLSDLDFKAHETLADRGLDSDLKCILRGISADLTLKLSDLDAAADGPAKDKALKELSYLLNDNVEVIKAPPAPPV
jgi:hypothetical protein